MDLLTPDEAAKLLKLGQLIQDSIAEYVKQDAALEPGQPASEEQVNARRNLIGSTGVILELVSDPGARIIELANQFFESRALHIVADARVSDLLVPRGGDGLEIAELSAKTGIETGKLCMIVRWF